MHCTSAQHQCSPCQPLRPVLATTCATTPHQLPALQQTATQRPSLTAGPASTAVWWGVASMWTLCGSTTMTIPRTVATSAPHACTNGETCTSILTHHIAPTATNTGRRTQLRIWCRLCVAASLLACTWPDDMPAPRHLASLAREHHSRCTPTQQWHTKQLKQ